MTKINKSSSENNTDNKNVSNTKVSSEKAKSSGFSLFIAIFIIFAAAAVIHTKNVNQLNQKISDIEAKTNQNISLINSHINELQNFDSKIKKDIQNINENLSDDLNDKISDIEENLQNKLIEYAANIKLTESSDVKSENVSSAETSPENSSRTVTIEKIQTPDEILLASGALIVRDMVENGLPIVYETEVLQILAQGNTIADQYVKTIKIYANSAVKGRRALISDFNRIYTSEDTKNAEQQENNPDTVSSQTGNNDWKEKILNFVKNIVFHKKKTEKTQILLSSNDEIYTLINDGKFSEALHLINAKDIAQTKSLKEWEKQVEDYLRFEQAINGLIANALAHIKLKEFNHDNNI